MAKKDKDTVPGPGSVTNRDIMQRLNFLYQASQMLGALGLSHTGESQQKDARGKGKRVEKREKNRRRHPTNMLDLSRSYVQSMKTIGTKTNVRMYVPMSLALEPQTQRVILHKGSCGQAYYMQSV